MDDPGALVCCTADSTTSSLYSGTAADGICDRPPLLFFLTRRLARFPEAWLLPLFPFFIRLIHQSIQRLSFAPTGSMAQHRLARRRLYLYITLIQIRGWILYLLFDKIEEYIVASAGTNCWYENLLHQSYSSCQGQVSDFSDHIVLYFAQILPIPLTEILHCIVEPFWKSKTNSNSSSSTGPSSSSPFRMAVAIPLMLLSGLLYLYIATFIGAYKTATYFHTPPEIINGYLISLLIQVPLFLMQCTTWMESTREYFFGYAL